MMNPKNKLYKSAFLLRFILLLFLVTSINVYGQISLSQMNGIKINWDIKEVENEIGQKLKLAKINKDEVKTTVLNKGIKLDLRFSREQSYPNYELIEISTVSNKIKTLSGIGVGSTLNEVQKAYKKYQGKEGYIVDQTIGDKTKLIESYTIVESESMYILSFLFQNNIVSRIKIFTQDSW